MDLHAQRVVILGGTSGIGLARTKAPPAAAPRSPSSPGSRPASSGHWRSCRPGLAGGWADLTDPALVHRLFGEPGPHRPPRVYRGRAAGPDGHGHSGPGQGEGVLRLALLRGARAVPAGRRVDPGVLEDLPDRRWRHGDAKPGKLAVDAAVAPRLILTGQLQHHRPNSTARRRTSGAAAPRQPRPAAADDVAMPPQDRGGSDDQPSGRAGPARPGPATSTSNEREAARAGRQRADGATSGSRRPSTTLPAGTSPAPTRHG
jgi:hypothetical protein